MNLQPIELINVLIEEVHKDTLCVVQQVKNPVAEQGERQHVLQYLWLHRSEVEHIKVIRSEAWRTEYGPGSEHEVARLRRRTPAMELMDRERRVRSWDDVIPDYDVRPF